MVRRVLGESFTSCTIPYLIPWDIDIDVEEAPQLILIEGGLNAKAELEEVRRWATR
jgi:hypothetical protein